MKTDNIGNAKKQVSLQCLLYMVIFRGFQIFIIPDTYRQE